MDAQHAPQGGGVGIVHHEINRDPQYNEALIVPMRLPRLPSHNNSRAEKSFQAFKLSDNKPRMGHAMRHQEVRRKSHFECLYLSDNDLPK